MPDIDFEQELINSIINKKTMSDTVCGHSVPKSDLVDVSKIMSELAKKSRTSR